MLWNMKNLSVFSKVLNRIVSKYFSLEFDLTKFLGLKYQNLWAPISQIAGPLLTQPTKSHFHRYTVIYNRRVRSVPRSLQFTGPHILIEFVKSNCYFLLCLVLEKRYIAGKLFQRHLDVWFNRKMIHSYI